MARNQRKKKQKITIFTSSQPTLGAAGWWWFVAKAFFFATVFVWFRASFPRYRYDQIMRLGWKVFIPVTLVWLCVEAAFWVFKVGPWAA